MATSPATEFHRPAGLPLDGILLAEELLDLAERAQAYTNAAGVAIALIRGKELMVRTSAGMAPEVGSMIPMSDAFIGECLQRRRPLCCRDTESDSRIGPVFRAIKTRSLIAIPVCGQSEARGVMVVIAPLPNAFQPTHTAILMTLSDIIASKLAAREDPPDVEIQILDDPTPAIALTPDAAPALTVEEMPVIAPTPSELAPAPVEITPAAIEVTPAASQLVVRAAALELPVAETRKSAEPPVDPGAPAPASVAPPAGVVPAALLKVEPLPLVEDKKANREPGLLSPSEDPRHFKPQRASGATPVIAPLRPEPVKITAKPAAPVAIAKVAPPAPAASVNIAPSPAITSWEAPREEAGIRRFLAPALAVAAALVLAAVLWMHRSIAAEPTLPAIPALPVAAVALPPVDAAAVPAQPVAKNVPVVKPAIEEHAQPQASKPSETQTAAAQPKREPAVPVIEIAAAQPKPKLEPEPDVAAPKLALASNDAAVSNISKIAVAMPARPKSELIPATLLSRTAPVYPMMARQAGVYGTVVMNVTVATDGSVSGVRVIDGAMQLRKAAADAVRQWRYKPAMLNGKPVESSAEVQVNFTR